MKYQLINNTDSNFSTLQQILYNRGVSKQNIEHYLNLSDQDINSYLLLGEEALKNGLITILDAVKNNKNAIIIIDSDCDGYTSAALLVNYLYKIFPTWVENHLKWITHTSKQHGLNDCLNFLIEQDVSLIICPDSSSNDYEEHKKLYNMNKTILVLDHHLADSISKDAIIINNQLSNYPNKALSGVGVVWQFCRYIDSKLNANYANDFLDLVALGLTGDMMSLLSFETRYLITKGFQKENIKNPFIDYMIDKNSFPLSKSDYISYNSEMGCTSIGAAFFIVPFINAITRSGTMEEKYLLFDAMLNHKAFKKIPSNKRGHKPGETEMLILQAIRTVTNVKNRQTRTEEAGLEMLEKLIKNNNMLEHKILLFLLEPDQLNPEIRGLAANKLMAKYQRPCLVLTKTNHNTYEGSGRGCTKVGIDSFKNILEQCPGVIYVQGHENAHGVGICADQIDIFSNYIDQILNNISIEPIYNIDYDFKEFENNNQKIIDIAYMNDFWGQDFDRAYVNINFKITDSNFQIMKNNTLKFNLKNGLSVIKFNATDEEITQFTTTGYLEINAICKCNANGWNGRVYPQLLMEDYETIDSSKYFF